MRLHARVFVYLIAGEDRLDVGDQLFGSGIYVRYDYKVRNEFIPFLLVPWN